MKMGNQTVVSEFLLLGLPIGPDQQDLCYALFLAMYVTTVLGNLLIMFLIRLDPHLHTPMYLFLSNLSFSDLCFSSVTMPKLLQDMQSHVPSISYAGCLTQMYFFLLFADLESFLLVAMAYDRYVAICFPLHYTTVMSPRLCLALLRILVAVSWACAFSNALTHTVAISTLNFCGPNVINHFYCDLPQLFQLSCSSTQLNELLLFGLGVLMAGAPVILIVTSYIHVAAAVLRIRSSEGRKKAFSTCGSHLTVVGIFYGTGVFSYMRLGSVEASDKDKGIGILNTVISPMLNPLIYSLRNPDVQGALRRVLMGKRAFA
ncbi:unnamed protein product [Rangifer tarandus platyrhynchus]|uniref:Uncharacterized protein n=1 Tax=Rangifer tarandus platyrhynchus TaxID=3082113 RepID=A0AC59YY46_RANTA